MLKSNAPTQLTVAFASGAGAGPINAIPIPASSTAGAASWTTGFTSVNMEPIGSGGIPPFGADFNGLFNALSNAQIWEQAGYLYPYSSAFSTAVGGYPAGASLQMASGLGLWINQADSNTTNPDTTASANWVEMCANAGGASIALSGTSVTPTANQLGVRLLKLTGALSAACKLVLPLRNGASWKILNNTTGGQTVTVGGATGSAVTIAAGSAGAQEVFTDGTNYYTTSFNGSGVYLPVNGNAVSASKWANARAIAMSGDVVWSVSVDGSADAAAAGTIQAGAVTLAKMANLTASTLLGNPTGAAATPVAIPLVNGLQFTAGSLGMGNITPTSVTVNGVTSIGSSGAITINTVASNAIALTLTNTSSNGAQIALQGNGSTTPNKTIRAFGGLLQVVNSAGTAVILSLDDTGNLSSLANIAGSGTLTMGGNVAANGGTLQAGASTGSYTTLTYAGVLSTNRTINPASSASLALNLSGGYGGGLSLTDSSYNWGIWDQAGTLQFGSGTGGAALSPMYTFTAAGILTVNSANANGAQLVLNGIGSSSTNPVKTIRSRAGNLEVVNNAGTAIIMSLDDSGNFSAAGGANFTGSDERFKHGIDRAAEPQPLHRSVRYSSWYANADGAFACGVIAQDLKASAERHTSSLQYQDAVPGDDGRRLTIDKAGAAMEEAWWCGRQIDVLMDRLSVLEARVN